MRGREKFEKYKPIINFFIILVSLLPLRARKKCFESFRMCQGIIGLALRYILFKSIAKKCGDNVSIYPGVYLYNAQNISIGNNISIHPMCYIEGLGEIEIGNDVSIAHGVTILSTSHNFDNLNIPINNQGTNKSKVVINDNVWIGAKATILAGISIEGGNVIGAGSVITKNLKLNTVVAGVPAKLIKERVLN